MQAPGPHSHGSAVGLGELEAQFSAERPLCSGACGAVTLLRPLLSHRGGAAKAICHLRGVCGGFRGEGVALGQLPAWTHPIP